MTAQMTEILYMDGEEYNMITTPLCSNINICEYMISKEGSRLFQPVCTALYRGYRGTWKISHNKLYLTEIDNSMSIISKISKNKFLNFFKIDDATWVKLFPGTTSKNRNVFAEWYSGVITLVRGERLRSVHAGFASIYECELHLTIEAGVVVDSKVIQNSRDT